MKNLRIKLASAYNFLPFGPEGVSIDFGSFKNIVLVRGENRDARAVDPDASQDDTRSSSNGTGKSSIQEIIVWALYGKTVKRPEKLGANDVVHNKVGKDTRVELVFDDYRVVRTRKEGGSDKKNSLRLWESPEGRWEKETEITQGTMALTQKRIEDIIGLSYDAFVNICIFTDDQRACFLECDNRQKKEIVENMMSLGTYREWHEGAKAMRKEAKSKIELKTKEFAILDGNKADATRRLEVARQKEVKWREDKREEIEQIQACVDKLVAMMQKTDDGQAQVAYDEAQEQIKEINEKLPELNKSKRDAEDALAKAVAKENEIKAAASTVTEKINEASRSIRGLMADRKKKQEEVARLSQNEPGSTCDKCLGEILEDNIKSYVGKIQSEIAELNNEMEIYAAGLKGFEEEAKQVKDRQTKVKTLIDGMRTKISNIDNAISDLSGKLLKASKVKQPVLDEGHALVQQKIDSFKQSISDKAKELSGESPFCDIIKNDEEELRKSTELAKAKDEEVKSLEADLPYYDYWISGFGDHGIRKWVIDGIIPELNGRVNYWLQFLIDNRITLRFDNELNETIERNPADGDPYVYHAMSTGQRRRLNLAVSQSFAHVMSLSSGSLPSVVFLDEVTTNVDPLGVQGIYNMIMELSEDKQVFITTHDQDLLRMLDGCDTLKMVHENGFTTISQ